MTSETTPPASGGSASGSETGPENGDEMASEGWSSYSTVERATIIGTAGTIVGVLIAVIALFGPFGSDDKNTGTGTSTSPTSTTTTSVSSTGPAPTQDKTARPQQGDFTLQDGESADLETGVVGIAVPNHDVSLSTSSTGILQYLNPSSGAIAEISTGADPEKCAQRLEANSASTNMIESGEAYCLRTVEGNIASLQIVKLSSYPSVISLHYILWQQ
ncbi:hypothetical protein ACFVMC_32360 [Nocardia sp. NPDC127579]|uniref:hypothetical protein n=1 Tax=Nocardia sp. NPDC127579 TaxID=3345402 RepID=UPI0036251D6C